MEKTNEKKECNKINKTTVATKHVAAAKACTKAPAKPVAKKCTKKAKAKNKKPAFSRADKRQIAMTASLLDEKNNVDEVVKYMEDRLYSLDTKEMNPVDRDLLAVRCAVLKAYSEILFATAHFEHVRIRRGNGEYLHRDPVYLRHYLLGDAEPIESRLTNECKKTCCKKTCSKNK